jgi:hypothetical protein
MLVVSKAPFGDRKFIAIYIGNMQMQIIPEVMMFVAIERMNISKLMLVAKASIVFINTTETMKQNAAKRYGFIKLNMRFILYEFFCKIIIKSVQTKKEP